MFEGVNIHSYEVCGIVGKVMDEVIIGVVADGKAQHQEIRRTFQHPVAAPCGRCFLIHERRGKLEVSNDRLPARLRHATAGT
jgi:bacterioferritin-associated ferredoxin